MTRTQLLTLAISIATTLGCNTIHEPTSLSKDDARARGGKTDTDEDACAVLGWYGDGECDDWCALPDPDCNYTGDGGVCSPARCDLLCPSGLERDEHGCEICRCADTCSPVTCDLLCPDGFAQDESGCDICRCSNTPLGCSSVTCDLFCPYGYEEGLDGCPLCTCAPPSPCTPTDAEGVGLCDLFLGFVWTGTECTILHGCACDGDDCAETYATVEACEDAHASCGAE